MDGERNTSMAFGLDIYISNKGVWFFENTFLLLLKTQQSFYVSINHHADSII